MKVVVPEVGSRVGETKWTFLSIADKKHWMCRCDCGAEHRVNRGNIRSGISKQCRKCLYASQVTHGGCPKDKSSRAPEYNNWASLKDRCLNPNSPRFDSYGGRGIKVCDRWMGEDGFKNFLADMGPKPSKDHSIDRVNTDGNYEPSNCRWATRSEQQRNKTTTNLIEYQGKSQCASDWAEEWGMTLKAFSSRYERGWSMERIHSTPLGIPRGKQVSSPKKQVIEYKGKVQTAEEWAKEFGLTTSAMTERLKHGWSMERIECSPQKFGPDHPNGKGG